MRTMTTVRVLFCLGLAVLMAGGGWPSASAEELAQQPTSDRRFFVTAGPWYQGDGGLDSGGDFQAWGMILRGGVSTTVGDGHRVGLTLNYGFTHYSFSSPTAFGGTAPWDDIHRIGLSIPLLLRGENGWGYLMNPSVDLAMEGGADPGDAFEYGGVVAILKRFDSDRQIGLGVGVFSRLEKISVFPAILVNWRLTEQLSIVNPTAPGLTGGAGLELKYQIDKDWTIGAGGNFRSSRFRLSDDGQFPNGIGEERGVVAFIHADRRFGEFQFDIYAGAVVAGRLDVENSDGDRLVKEDFDPAPLVGASLSLQF